jgi:hypothetical protein
MEEEVKRRGPGRPLMDGGRARTERVTSLFTPEESESLRAAAGGEKLSNWVRKAALEAAVRKSSEPKIGEAPL